MRRQACVLCEVRPATRRGEHVLPQWYLRDRGHGPGPHPWSRNGEPILDREGRPIALSQRVRVLLPACDLCNSEMDRRFEKPAKQALRRLFYERGATVLRRHEVRPVALWFLKTLLLHARPEARYDHSRIDALALRWDVHEVPPHRYYKWLVTGHEPPPGLSLWLVRSDEGEDDCPPPRYWIPLPTVFADGSTIEFVNFQITFHGMNVTLVVHPGWDIRHPLEEEKVAVRLWPEPSAELDLRLLPVVSRKALAWLKCTVTLKQRVLGSAQLPPLQHSSLPFSIPPDMAPFIETWEF